MLTSVSATTETVYAAQMQPIQLVPATQTTDSGSAFGAVLDAINPLQHIPIISNLYRAAQGAPISAMSQIAGDTLYGGLLGGVVSSFITSLADVAVKEVSGKGIGEHVLTGLDGEKTAPTVEGATALIPVAGDVQIAGSFNTDTSLNAKADEATQIILRTGINPERVAGQYQRAQTLDITNKLLVSQL